MNQSQNMTSEADVGSGELSEAEKETLKQQEGIQEAQNSAQSKDSQSGPATQSKKPAGDCKQ